MPRDDALKDRFQSHRAMISATGNKDDGQASHTQEESFRPGTAIREHWSVENLYHHKRDNSACLEDRIGFVASTSPTISR